MEVTKNRYNYRKPTRNKSNLKRILAVALILILFVSTLGYSYIAINKSSPTLGAQTSKNFAYQAVQTPMSWPSAGMAAIGGLDDGVYEVKGGQDNIAPIASMTKVITALVILDKAPLSLGNQGEIYTVSERDVAIYNEYVSKQGSVMPVAVGQQLSQYQLLQGLMLPSGNNAADYLAIWQFGSLDEYAKYANDYLSSRGLTKTHVDDASGFSALSVSSPSEMIKLGQLALKSDVISEIVAQKSAVIPGSGEIKNTNLLLNDANVVGVKTGSTDEAGKCLLFAVKHGPNLSHTLIGVVMGQPDWLATYNSARNLRDVAVSNFEEIEVIAAKTVVANFQTEWGESSNVLIDNPLTIYGWKSNSYQADIKIDRITSPIKSGSVVGQVSIVNHPNNHVDLKIEDSISQPSIIWRLLNYW